MSKMIDEVENALARKIKEVRRSRGWSLSDFEVASLGEIKAVTLGSYERCARVISVRKLATIAKVFGVPVTYLLGKSSEIEFAPQTLMIDLRKLKSSKRADQFEELIHSIISIRGDWNGEVLTLRYSDLQMISLFRSEKTFQTLNFLRAEKYLIEPTLK